MADDAPTQDLSEETQPSEDQPEKLRVHSLARVLGTTSKRVLDALTELDGRSRSPQSTVEEDEAERVREAWPTAPTRMRLRTNRPPPTSTVTSRSRG